MSAVRTDRNAVRPITPHERRRAGIWCAAQALGAVDPATAARELLWATGLLADPEAKGDSHAYRKRTAGKKGASA